VIAEQAIPVKIVIEHSLLNPKDGDLYLGRVKPGEILVEAQCDTDVQIVHPT